jgi:hypothetical protein
MDFFYFKKDKNEKKKERELGSSLAFLEKKHCNLRAFQCNHLVRFCWFGSL